MKYEVENSGAVSTEATSQNITCEYSDHMTSSEELCEVWCQIQAVKSIQWVFCPTVYESDPEETLLCSIWKYLVDQQNSPDSTTIQSPSFMACPHESNPTSNDKLCDLWCHLQAYSGLICCPSPYINDPEESLLCKLWNELEELEELIGTNPITSGHLIPVDVYIRTILPAVILSVTCGVK